MMIRKMTRYISSQGYLYEQKKDKQNLEDLKTETKFTEEDQREGEEEGENQGENKEEQEQQEKEKKEKEEGAKKQEINIIPENKHSAFILQNNHPISNISKVSEFQLIQLQNIGGKGMEENKLIQTKQAKVNLLCNSIFLSYNELRDLYDFKNIIEKTMYQSDRLSWIDISHNYLQKIPKV